MHSPILTKPPVTAAEIPPEWAAAVINGLNNTPGSIIRAAPDAPAIEVWSQRRARFMRLMLPGGATEFVSVEDRNALFASIVMA